VCILCLVYWSLSQCIGWHREKCSACVLHNCSNMVYLSRSRWFELSFQFFKEICSSTLRLGIRQWPPQNFSLEIVLNALASLSGMTVLKFTAYLCSQMQWFVYYLCSFSFFSAFAFIICFLLINKDISSYILIHSGVAMSTNWTPPYSCWKRCTKSTYRACVFLFLAGWLTGLQVRDHIYTKAASCGTRPDLE